MQGPFIYSTIRDETAVGASDTTTEDSMPTQPCSALLLTVLAQLDTANTSDDPITLLQALKSIRVEWRGYQMWNVRGDDLYRITRAAGLWSNRLQATGNGTNAKRYITLVIPFGKRLGDRSLCYPSTLKGDSLVHIDWTADPSTYNTLSYSLAALQIADLQPPAFLRCTQMTDTPAATGYKDYPLPRSGQIIGIGITTTTATPATATPGVEDASVRVNNLEWGYGPANFEELRALASWRIKGEDPLRLHVHNENTAGAYTQNASTLTEMLSQSPDQKFGWMEFDWLDDQSTALDARGVQDCVLRVNYNTAEATRITTLEVYSSDNLLGKALTAGGVARR